MEQRQEDVEEDGHNLENIQAEVEQKQAEAEEIKAEVEQKAAEAARLQAEAAKLKAQAAKIHAEAEKKRAEEKLKQGQEALRQAKAKLEEAEEELQQAETEPQKAKTADQPPPHVHIRKINLSDEDKKLITKAWFGEIPNKEKIKNECRRLRLGNPMWRTENAWIHHFGEQLYQQDVVTLKKTYDIQLDDIEVHKI